jgi:uncharacterized protein (DUF2062 family)
VNPTAAPVPLSFWQRRLLLPVRAQLTRGVTPDQLARTLAIGTACSLLPFVGCTSVFNLGVGLWLAWSSLRPLAPAR